MRPGNQRFIAKAKLLGLIVDRQEVGTPHEYQDIRRAQTKEELLDFLNDRARPVVQQNISYKRELLAGDIVEVRSRVLEVGEKSLRFLHEIWNVDTRELAASCELTGVHVDRRVRKAVPFPEAVREAALADITATG
jgi:acyl-CoA thioesterase FadM